MSIQNNFPALKPTLLLDFANVKQLDPRITFTRASTATYYGTQTAKAEENLLLQSQDFTTTWSNVGTTDTANTSVAPDGTTTADTLTENPSGSGLASISQTLTFIAGLPYTLSFFVKQGTQTFAQLLFSSGAFGVNAYANFNVTTGAGAVGTVGSSTTASIVDAGNGWYRCVITATATTTTSSTVQLLIIESATDARAPSITLDSGTILLWGAQLEQRSAATAYTPTTTQPITNYIPQLLTAASGVARFDHNPTTLESLGLLIEESRTNLLTYSEQFDNAAWTKVSSSITANAIVAPDGTLTGDKLVENTASANHVVRPTTASVTSGTTYTYSIFVKAGERTQFQIGFGTENSAFAAAVVQFTLTGLGTATAVSGSPTFSIAPVGNGWYRCTATATATATASAFIRNYLVSGTNVYTGDGYSGIYIWGAQLEAGAFATSYIPTVASQVTRAADAASMTGTNFSSWFNQAEGTIYAEGFLNNPAVTGAQIRRLADINDGSNNNRIGFGHSASSAVLRTQYEINGASLNGTNGQTASSVFPSAKVAVAYQAGNYAFSPNGATPTTSTAANVPVVNKLSIGNDAINNALGSANGTIRKIAYYPLRVTNAQLQALTS